MKWYSTIFVSVVVRGFYNLNDCLKSLSFFLSFFLSFYISSLFYFCVISRWNVEFLLGMMYMDVLHGMNCLYYIDPYTYGTVWVVVEARVGQRTYTSCTGCVCCVLCAVRCVLCTLLLLLIGLHCCFDSSFRGCGCFHQLCRVRDCYRQRRRGGEQQGRSWFSFVSSQCC